MNSPHSPDSPLPDDGAPITLVSGCPDQSICGVFDYTGLLADALRDMGGNASVYNASDWSIGGMLRIKFALRRSSIVHLQYPSLAFEGKRAPYLFFFDLLTKPKVVTFHEFSRKSRMGRIMSLPLLILANSIIVTSPHEAKAITSTYKFARRKLSVIPIGSNIAEAVAPTEAFDIVYFGQIRANKGIEEFLDLVEEMPHLSAAFIGGFGPDNATECVPLVERARSLGATVRINETSEAIAELIASSRLAVLPFPNGLTDRRGSALAAMINRTLVVSTRAPGGHSHFDDLAELAEDASKLGELVSSALNDMDARKGKIERAYAYAKGRSWPAIAKQHIDVYRSLKRNKSGRAALPAH